MDEAQAARIAEALETTRTIVKDLDTRSRQQQEVLIEIRHDVRAAGETATKLNTLIFTGNGSKSLMTRVSLLEQNVLRVENSLERERLDKSKVRAAWITSMLALLGTLTAALIALLK